MRIGVHVSAAGGYPRAAEYARDVGAECVQLFAKSPRQWRAPALSAEKAATLAPALESAGVRPAFTHTAYLINLGTTDDALRERSIAALADEIVRAELLGAAAVVTHLGTAPDGPMRAAPRIATGIAAAFSASGTSRVRLLLENTAGAGTTFGSTPEELGDVLASLPDDARDRTGVCLDTCHAWAAGLDLSDPEGWRAVIDRFEVACGAGVIELVHANDCAYALGSRKDRHAWIGDGAIGSGGFAAMFAETRLTAACAVMEMPGEAPFKDAENISRLKALRASSPGAA
ncbi:MAG: deoxyribonuclease IV [Coriobacteriia bacterium]